MKKFAVLSAVCLMALISVQSRAQAMKKDPKVKKITLHKHMNQMVDYMAKDQFYTDFGKVSNVQWQRTPYFDQATFTKNGKTMTAYYDDNDELVGTTSEAKFSDLPAAGQKQIKDTYKNYRVGPIIFFNDNEANDTDMLLYGTQFDDEDSYFVELNSVKDRIVVHVTPDGNVYYFKDLGMVS